MSKIGQIGLLTHPSPYSSFLHLLPHTQKDKKTQKREKNPAVFASVYCGGWQVGWLVVGVEGSGVIGWFLCAVRRLA